MSIHYVPFFRARNRLWVLVVAKNVCVCAVSVRCFVVCVCVYCLVGSGSQAVSDPQPTSQTTHTTSTHLNHAWLTQALGQNQIFKPVLCPKIVYLIEGGSCSPIPLHGESDLTTHAVVNQL